MKRVIVIACLVFITVALSATSKADVPDLINYQGRLLDSSGDPVADGPYLLKFIIYDAATAGTALWNSGFQTVQVTDGLFEIRLGESPQPALTSTIFSNTDRWLGITVSTDPEITPRTRLTTVAYAYEALSSDTSSTTLGVEDGVIELSDIAQNGAATNQIIKWNGTAWSVTTSMINDLAVATGKLANDAVTSNKIQDGTVATVDIANDAVTTVNINDLAVTNGKIANDAVTSTKILDNTITSADIATGAVTQTELAANAVDDTKILDGSIRFQDIGQNGAASGQVMKWNGTAWVAASDVSSSYWQSQPDSVLYTTKLWGLARGGAGNFLYGNLAYTMTNFGTNSSTGSLGMNYQYATVSGGNGNVASFDYATVGGGHTNTAGGINAVVAGGESNNAIMDYTFIGGGQGNNTGGLASAIGGGVNNSIEFTYDWIGGGEANVIQMNADWSVVCGGRNNVIQEHDWSVICGGENNNLIGPTGQHNVISGGFQNMIDGQFCAIPGGSLNNIVPGAVPPTNHSMVYGFQVDCNTPFEVLLYEGTNPGAVMINRDDLDGPPAGPLTVGTNPGNGNGAFLTAGGVWTNTSSRELKDNFSLIDGNDLLQKIRQLPMESWQYKGSAERHIWPCSEDFVALFDVGRTNAEGVRDNAHLAAGDVAGVALAGVQQLAKENEELRQLVDDLLQRIEQLEAANH